MRVEKVIHIADLHVRTGNRALSRYEEYKGVFDRIVEDVSAYPPALEGKAIVVIAGDVFHHKLKIESPGIKLILGFLSNLASIAPVYVIRGNHDYRQDFPGEPDLIESLLSIEIPNVTYLNTTGHYRIGKNLGVGLVAIQDALHAGNTSGIVPELPLFPPATFFDMAPEVTTRIALFHGSVARTMLPNGMQVEDAHSYPLEWFAGYDAVMLGDIHLQQVQNATPVPFRSAKAIFRHSVITARHSWATGQPFAYAGSTVQQDFGEPLIGHGFLVWDLVGRTIDSYHTRNDLGFVTLRPLPCGELGVGVQRNAVAEPISSALKSPWFPRRVSIRVVTGKDDNIEKSIIDTFSMNNVIIEKMMFCPQNQKHVDKDTPISSTVDISQFNTPNAWADYVSKKAAVVELLPGWRDWFFNCETIALPKPPPGFAILGDKIDEKNTKIIKKVGEYHAIRDTHLSLTSTKKPFVLHHLAWDYILCFKADNYFCFDDLSHKINSISARNGMGKTSFLETVCVALYGEGFPSRFNKTYSASIICSERPKGAASQTTLVLSVGGTRYRVKRKFAMHSSDANKIHCVPKDITVDREQEGVFVGLHSGKTAVDAWVNDSIGPISAFLLSCMVTQSSDMDFFNLRAQDQKELLDNALAINDSTEFQAVLKEARLAHMSILDAASAIVSSQAASSGDIAALENSVKEALEALCSLQKEAEGLKSRLTPIPSDASEVIFKEKTQASLEKRVHSLEEEVGQNTSPLEELQKRLEERTLALNGALRARPDLDDSILKAHERQMPNCLKETSIDDIKGSYDASAWLEVGDPEHLEKCLEKLEEWRETLKRAEMRYRDCEKSLKNMESHPFNPDCWACASQPWKAEEKALRQKLANLELVIKKVCEKTRRLSGEDTKTAADLEKVIEGLESHLEKAAAISWHDRFMELTDAFGAAKKKRQVWQGGVEGLEEKVAAAQREVREAMRCRDAALKLALYKRCIAAFDAFTENASINERISEVNRNIIEARVRASVAEREMGVAVKAKALHETLTSYVTEVQARLATLSRVSEAFGGFKVWLYTEKVLPALASGANGVMRVMCEERPLSLECVMAGGVIHWFLRDGKSAPPIEKASGFQRFIAGLAMRIALGRFGASGICATQLFLDEGFTACDMDNLGKVGPFLENLPYKNIVLVSHLEEVKSCAGHHIAIERVPPSTLSQLRFGRPKYPLTIS